MNDWLTLLVTLAELFEGKTIAFRLILKASLIEYFMPFIESYEPQHEKSGICCIRESKVTAQLISTFNSAVPR